MRVGAPFFETPIKSWVVTKQSPDLAASCLPTSIPGATSRPPGGGPRPFSQSEGFLVYGNEESNFKRCWCFQISSGKKFP